MTIPMQLIQNLDDEEQRTLAQQLLAAMDQGGIERRKNYPIFSEDDYAAGALNIMHELGLWNYIGGRALLILSGTALSLGPGQRRPTDKEMVRYHEKQAKGLREANSWPEHGTVLYVSREGERHGEARVAWADGYGEFLIGHVRLGYEKDLDSSHDIELYHTEAEAAKQFGLEHFEDWE